MILFHASPFIIEHPDIYHSRKHLDFGKGFYLTTMYEQARKYVMRFVPRKPIVYINKYIFDDDFGRRIENGMGWY